MSRYRSVVMRKSDGESVYQEIKAHLESGDTVLIDFSGIDTMTTYFAKQVFGRLYVELGVEGFTSRIKFEKDNMSSDVELVLKIGITGAISAL